MGDPKPDYLKPDERDLLAECDRLGGALSEAFKEHFRRIAEARRVAAELLDSMEELERYPGKDARGWVPKDTHRQWASTAQTWLYPNDAVGTWDHAKRDALAAALKDVQR